MASAGVGPRVGVAALIVNPDNRVLIGKRKSSHGAGESQTLISSSTLPHHHQTPTNHSAAAGKYQLPGGHLEYGEDPLVCAEREAEEETGLKIKACKFVHMTNDVFEAEKKHYVTLFVWCEMVDPSAEPQVSLAPSPLPFSSVCRDRCSDRGANWTRLIFSGCKTMEPDKCESWAWSSIEELRGLKGDSEPGDVVFLPLDHLLSQTRDLEALRP